MIHLSTDHAAVITAISPSVNIHSTHARAQLQVLGSYQDCCKERSAAQFPCLPQKKFMLNLSIHRCLCILAPVHCADTRQCCSLRETTHIPAFSITTNKPAFSKKPPTELVQKWTCKLRAQNIAS